MQIGFGVLRLSADAFYSMTLPELSAAVEGWPEAHGGAGGGDRRKPPDSVCVSKQIRAAFSQSQ